MLSLLKQLLAFHQNQTDILNREDIQFRTTGSATSYVIFLLQFQTPEQLEQMLVELVLVQHPRLFQVEANCLENNREISVKILFPQTETSEACKLVETLIEKQAEIKETNGKSNTA
jgi:hypothetical protein